jgi:hypothetical protein
MYEFFDQSLLSQILYTDYSVLLPKGSVSEATKCKFLIRSIVASVSNRKHAECLNMLVGTPSVLKRARATNARKRAKLSSPKHKVGLCCLQMQLHYITNTLF